MEDVGKPQYLVQDSKGPKLKRNVPKDVRELAGRTAWTERVSGLSMTEVRKRANQFATRTDAEIASLRAQSGQAATHGVVVDAERRIALTDLEVRQVAIRFFYQQDKANVEDGSYTSNSIGEALDNTIIDAGADYAEARQQAAGAPGFSDRTTVKALVDFGFLPKSALPDNRRSPVPEELRAQRWFQYLCRLIERAEVELARRRLEALQSGYVPPAADELFRTALPDIVAVSQPRVPGPRRTVSDLVSAFVAKKKIEVGSSRQSQFRVPMRALEEELGRQFPVAEVSRQHCKDLAALFVRIPAYVGQHYKDMTLRAAADTYEKQNGQSAARYDEAAKHMAVLRRVFDFAVNEEWIAVNPAQKVEVDRPLRRAKKFEAKGEKYQPFEMSDLKAIFGGKFYNDRNAHPLTGRGLRTGKYEPHRFWTPLLALWTGARMNELLQLERADIKEESGIPFIAVTDQDEIGHDPETFTKRVKTTQSVRDIPLHPELVRLGFLDWALQRKPGRLFPEAKQPPNGKPSDIYSKRFKTLIDGCGVWVPRRKVFHSFRNSFNDAMRDAGVPEEMRSAINGWSNQKTMDGRYGRGHKVSTLYGEIKKVTYPGLDLSHLYPSASKGS